MRHLILFISIFIWVFQVNGQDSHVDKLKDIGYTIKKNNFIEGNKTLTEDQIAGSPYLNRQFTKSLIIKEDQSEIRDIPLRYNIFSNRMEFKQNGTVLYIADAYAIKRIILGDKVFVYARYMTSRNIKASYFQCLTEGKYQLLKMYKIAFKSSDNKADNPKSNRFENEPPNYYFRYRNGMSHLIKSQKELIKILQPIPDEIVNYIREKKINPKNEQQLIDLMNYADKVMD